MKLIHRIWKYFLYVLKSGNAHNVHSPFLYSFYTYLVGAEKENEFQVIKRLRKKLGADKTIIRVTDLGAGESAMQRRVCDIYRKSALPEKYGRALFRICCHFQPARILELGTSLGVSSLYMAAACPSAKITTVEGSSETAAYASAFLRGANLGVVEVISSSFEDYLSVLPSGAPFDLIFVDGNHTQEATLRYYEILKAYSHLDTVFIFDDIHWSREMSSAWGQIRGKREVTVSLDIYRFGLIWRRLEQHGREEFCLRY